MNTVELTDMNCAMEQCIAHHICAQFSNVPKVYSGNNLNRYLAMRDNYRNKENLKLIYLLALNDAESESECTYINKTKIYFSIVENNTNQHCYTYALEGNKTPVRFYKELLISGGVPHQISSAPPHQDLFTFRENFLCEH